MLLTDEEFADRYLHHLRQLGDVEQQDFAFSIASGHSGLPRASSLGGCGRAQYHRLTGVPETDPGNPAYAWPAMMGHAGEALIGEVLHRMGYTVTRVAERLESPHATGHLDYELTGCDLGEDIIILDCKLRGLFAYRHWFTDGLDDETIMQMQWYMAQRGRKRAMVLTAPHDYSAMRNENVRYKVGIPNVIIHRFWVEADAALQQLAEDRAQGLLAARALGMGVRREFDPASKAHSTFPCGFCGTRSVCIQDDLDDPAGDNMFTLSPMP